MRIKLTPIEFVIHSGLSYSDGCRAIAAISPSLKAIYSYFLRKQSETEYDLIATVTEHTQLLFTSTDRRIFEIEV